MGDLVLDGDRVVAAAGYLAWPGGIARLSVLTDPAYRGHGLARLAGSAAVRDALACARTLVILAICRYCQSKASQWSLYGGPARAAAAQVTAGRDEGLRVRFIHYRGICDVCYREYLSRVAALRDHRYDRWPGRVRRRLHPCRVSTAE